MVTANDSSDCVVQYPSDWGFMPFGKCCIDKLTYGINAPAVPYSSNYPAYIRITDINDDGTYNGNDKKSVITTERERYALHTGDIVVARTGASTGKSYLYDIRDGAFVYAGFLIRASVDEEKHNAKYIASQLRTPRYWSWVAASSMRSGQPGINSKQYASFLIPVAPKKEQDAIAETLSCIDEHIANLAEFIEKKKAIRDGALEDLVSGRTRLKGFDGEWVEYSFDGFFTLLSNNTLSRDKLTNSGSIGNIHYGDVLIKYHDILSDKDSIPRVKANIDMRSFKFLQVGDVVIADTAEDDTVGKAIQICNVSIPLVGGLHTIVCRPNYDTAIGYLGYYVNSKNYHNQLLPHITGIKVSSISKKAIKTTSLRLPDDVDEQRAIVEVLSSLDAEIASLKKEKDKMLQIKAGAMDDLLTGRIRLTRQGG